ncbi:MAG: hypothetical protein KDA51_02325, partial [Planctomycetales bacterium]|nr:hypothetical protein [Planctomycetales bacterium]
MSHTQSRRICGLSMIATSLVAFALLAAEVQAQVRQLTPPRQGSAGTASTVTAASAIEFFNNAKDPSDAGIRLQVYDVPSELIGPVGAQIQVHFHNVPDVRVTTEPGSGKLMVMAPQNVHREIATQINGFMQQNRISAGDRGVSNLASTRQQSYDLQHLDWRGLEDALRRLAGERLSVTTERGGEVANLQLTNATGRPDIIQVDRRQNKVALLGGAPSTAGWTQVVRTLDQGSVDPRSATRILPLAPAEPRSVKRAFQLVKTTIQDEAGNQGGNNQPGGGEARVELGADGQATAMGSFDTLSAASGMFGDVQIEFIEEIDLVIIRGRPQDVERALKVIDEIKRQAKESQPEVEIYPLKNANGEAVAALVTQLYETVYAPRQGSVSITALGQPNALLLIGRAEVVESVRNLVDKIDQPLDPQNQLKVIPLLHASSEDLQARIREFFVNNPGVDTTIRPGLGTRVKVLSDYRTNSLIVQAAPREML